MSDPFQLPPGTERLSVRKDCLAFAATRGGTRRLVRIERVMHLDQTLTVTASPGETQVFLEQRYERPGGGSPDGDRARIGMSAEEARHIGARLIAAADVLDEAQASSGSGASPNTSEMTSLAAADVASSAGSNASASYIDFSTARRIPSLCWALSASSGVLFRWISSSIRRIASTARCWPSARASRSVSDIPSSMVSRIIHGSGPGEGRHHGVSLVRALLGVSA